MDGTVSGTFGEIFGRLDQWSFWGRALLIGLVLAAFFGLRGLVAQRMRGSWADEKAGAVVLGIGVGLFLIVIVILDLIEGNY
jgi:hypothetical protein